MSKVSRFVIAVGGNWMNEWMACVQTSDVMITPETLFWLARAQWDAAERGRSDYLRSPSPRSTLEHPEIWQRNRMRVNTKRQQLAVTITFFYYEDSFVMTQTWPCLCYSRHSAGAPREIDNTTDLQRWGGAYGWPESIPWLIIIAFKCYKLFASELKWMEKNHLEEAAQGFIQYHLNTLNLLRKDVWRGKNQSCQETFR